MCANGNNTMNKSAIKKTHTHKRLWKWWISSSILTLSIINVEACKHI